MWIGSYFPATLLGQFTNNVARKLAQQGAFFRKKQYNNVFGSLEEYKGSV
jgi:hypothetical protein